MEELIFFAVIIFFSIIDSIARSRKKKQQAEGPTSTSGLPQGWEPEEEVESYDSYPSYEDLEEEEKEEEDDGVGDPLPRYTRPYGSMQTRGAPSSSEGMIPTDIWEEIAGLATGKTSAPTRSAPPLPVPAPLPARPVQTHRVHQAHAEYGTDPSSRSRSEQDGMDPLAFHASADILAVRKQLRRQGGHALRQAIILHEILGPPAALRRDRFED